PYDVLVIGSYSVDLIFSGMTEFPQLGKDTLSTGFKMTPGEAFISAVCLHRLGLKVGWAADFGNDDFSQFALHAAREENLDESFFVFHKRPYRRISAAASYPNERAFLTYYDPEPQIPAALNALIKANARALYIPGLFYGSHLDAGVRLAGVKNMKMVMDGNSSRGEITGKSRESTSIRKALKYMDIFLPNAQEARRLTGEADLEQAIRVLAEYCPLVVIKDGAHGAYAYAKGSLVYSPAIGVDPVDTTGAGDNFNAGFLYAWLDHLPLETCLRWGNIVGGLSTTEPGGTTRRITLVEIQSTFSREYPHLPLESKHP
ncbi:MAG: carbohydrate kinase family protein, partial [Acidobacteriaceae bacterium]